MITCEPSPHQLESLLALPERLARLNYNEKALAELFQVPELAALTGAEWPAYDHYAQQAENELADLGRFFLTRGLLERERVEHLLGSSQAEALEQLGLLRQGRRRMASRVDLYPCRDRFLFTGMRLVLETHPVDHVYHLGTDSYALARYTPRRACRRALDLCTGSGVQAVLAATHCDQVEAVDLNPKALKLARFNADWNGLGSRCRFYQSDLFAALKPGRYDLITANPPFVATPEVAMQLFRTGGESGENLTRRIVAALPERLEEGGTLAMVTDFPHFGDRSYLDRLEEWLGSKTGWGIAVLNLLTRSKTIYARQHMPPARADDWDNYEKLFRHYLETFDRLGIECLKFGLIFIRRLPADAPNWKAERELDLTPAERGQLVERWLSILEKTRRPGWLKAFQSWQPRLADDVLWVRDPHGWLKRLDSPRGSISLTQHQAAVAEALGHTSVESMERLPEWNETVGLLAEGLLLAEIP